jgi:alpha-mannosidase
MQNWISVSDEKYGVTLSSSVVAWDYHDPTGPTNGVTLLQPILLASRRSCHGEGNWYLQEGDHHYRFSLTSHPPGWRNGRQFGVGANVPVAVVCNGAPAPKRSLPEQLSFFSIDAANVVLSTMKLGEDDDRVVLRVWESDGKEASPTLNLHWPVRSAERTDIIEEEGTPTAVRREGMTIAVGHHSIETFKLVPVH